MSVNPGLAGLAHEFRPARHHPQGALVLLHGRAVTEKDIAPLLDVLDPDRRLVGVAPRGPHLLPPGGQHWYKTGRVGFPDPESFRTSDDALEQWLDQLAKAIGVPASRTVVGGFSQGGVMAYAQALGPGRPRLAGVLAMSAFLPRVDGFALHPDAARDLPVLITHGSEDPIVPIDLGRDARDKLEERGAEVTYLESAVPHAVDPEHADAIREWISEQL